MLSNAARCATPATMAVMTPGLILGYLAELWSDPAARLVPLAADKVLVQPRAPEGAPSPADTQGAAQPGHPQDRSYPKLRPVLLRPAAAAAAALTAPGATPTFLGKDAAGVPYFALELADAQAALNHLPQFQLPPQQPHQAPQPPQLPQLPQQATEQQAAQAHTAGPNLAPSDAALLAVAAAYAQWHAANCFSAATGAPTTAIAGGAGRRCSSSRASVYPRIDPAVIMLVTAEGGRQASRGSGHKGAAALAGDWALLGRKAEWPPGRYSTLAGFLEVRLGGRT
ncbi:hypothetical protein QJQ45_004727 [Haematococcus lacustris]|nr:hypothetical protein QJQ45_004727 [Haematococcus lacustris]